MGPLQHGFWFWLDGRLKMLFGWAYEVVLKAWAPSEVHVPNRFTFHGTLDKDNPSGTRVVMSYNQCGFEGYCQHRQHEIGMMDIKAGEVVIREPALKVIRRFLQSAGGATHVYVGVRMDVSLVEGRPQREKKICVDELQLLFEFNTALDAAQLEISGLGDYSVLTAVTLPFYDAWRIFPDGKVRYFGSREEEVAEMPEWLKLALEE